MLTFLTDMSRKAKTTAKGKTGQKASKGTSKRTPKKTSSKTTKRTPGKTAKKTAKKTVGKPRAGARDSSLTQQQLPLVARVLILLAAFAAMVGFAVVLSRLTLEPSAASESLTHSNLRPGDSIRAYLSQPALRDTLKQLGGNIVLGMPFGALLPVLAPRTRGLLRVILTTAVVMLLVELVQGALVTGRAFDIDDVILNSTGAMLGYLILGRWLGRAVHPRRPHWWHRRTVSSSRTRTRTRSRS
ncbi:MAG: VanZ family protein [Streptomyces sp.]